MTRCYSELGMVVPIFLSMACAAADPVAPASERGPDQTHTQGDAIDEDDVEHAHGASDEPEAVARDDGARAGRDAGRQATAAVSPSAESAPEDGAQVSAGRRDAGTRATADDSERAPAAPDAGAEPDDGAISAEDGFDAGAGTLQPDGKTVVYRIPNGTGSKDWNPADKPIRIQRGMTLKLIDDDRSARGGGHWLHSFGICPHSSRAIGTGYTCTIPRSARLGLQSGLFEHNVANAGGRLYVVVVE